MSTPPLIVIFGAAARPDGSPSEALLRRIGCGLEAAAAHPRSPILCSGGAGPAGSYAPGCVSRLTNGCGNVDLRLRMRRIASLLVVGALWGCGRTMTEDDCQRVAANMRRVWDAESKKAQAPDGVPADRAEAVIKAEGERLVNDWTIECKKELQGRRIDAKELDCLEGAQSIEQINKCADL